MSSLLSYYQLQRLLKDKVVLFSGEEYINGASIDVTLGRCLLIERAPREGRQWNVPVSLRTRDQLPTTLHTMDDGEGYTVYPGEFVLAHTAQMFNLPISLTARFGMKSTSARVGLENLNACWCFLGSTQIPLLDGTTRTIENLVGTRPWVYSLDNMGHIRPGRAQRVWQSGEVKKLAYVALDNGEEFICTPEHRIMTRSGMYVAAANLNAGDSLMPLYRKLNGSGHELVYEPLIGRGGRWDRTHKLIDAASHDSQLPSGMSVHHKNHKKVDNTPANLERMDSIAHFKMHAQIHTRTLRMRELNSRLISQRNIENWKDSAYRDAMTERNRRNSAFTNNKRWGTPIPQEYLNHRVVSVSIRNLQKPAPVFDMEIPRWHNFAIGAGVFVHNCDPGWNGSVLTLELCNCSRYTPITIRPGDRIGQMTFQRVEGVPQAASYAVRGRYNGDRSVSGVKP